MSLAQYSGMLYILVLCLGDRLYNFLLPFPALQGLHIIDLSSLVFF